MSINQVLDVALHGTTPAMPADPKSDAPTLEFQGGESVVSAVAATPAIAEPVAEQTPPESDPMVEKKGPTSILVIDVGGTKIKILAAGQTEPRNAPSGKEFTPAKLVETVRGLAHDWTYDAISLGYPGLAGVQGPALRTGQSRPRLGWLRLRRRVRQAGQAHQ